MSIESYKIPIHRIISQAEPMRFACFVKASGENIMSDHRPVGLQRPYSILPNRCSALYSVSFKETNGSHVVIFWGSMLRSLFSDAESNGNQTVQSRILKATCILIFPSSVYNIFCLWKVSPRRNVISNVTEYSSVSLYRLSYRYLIFKYV